MTALVGGFPPELVGLVFAIVFVGGSVKGTAGSSYAIVSTAVLAAAAGTLAGWRFWVASRGRCLPSCWASSRWATSP